jgi:hypothetical protein
MKRLADVDDNIGLQKSNETVNVEVYLYFISQLSDMPMTPFPRTECLIHDIDNTKATWTNFQCLCLETLVC